MIVDLPGTTTTAVNKKLDELREKIGAVTMGRVLTLIIAPDSEEVLEQSLKAANDASQEHPSRIIVTMTGDPHAEDARLDAQLRAGGDAGAGEIVVLRLSGPLADHASRWSSRFCSPTSRWWRGGLTSPRRCPPRIPWASWRFGVSPMPPTAPIRCWPSRADCPDTPPVTPICAGHASPTGGRC